MTTINIFFKLLNFLTHLFLLGYVFKKYAYPYFVLSKKKFNQEIKEKKSAGEALQNQLIQLNIDQQNQVDYGKILESKCNMWVQKTNQKFELIEKQAEAVEQKIILRKKEQWVYIQRQRCLQKKLPIIFHRAEEHFKKLLDRDETSKKYCDSLIKFMKE